MTLNEFCKLTNKTEAQAIAYLRYSGAMTGKRKDRVYNEDRLQELYDSRGEQRPNEISRKEIKKIYSNEYGQNMIMDISKKPDFPSPVRTLLRREHVYDREEIKVYFDAIRGTIKYVDIKKVKKTAIKGLPADRIWFITGRPWRIGEQLSHNFCHVNEFRL